MNKKNILSQKWIDDLFIRVMDGANIFNNLDFNRLRYMNIPSSSEIKTNNVIFLNRDPLVCKLFKSIVHNFEIADASKVKLFNLLVRQFRFSDKNNLSALSKESIINFLDDINGSKRTGEIKDTTERQIRSDLSTILKILDLPVEEWFEDIPLTTFTENTPIRPYSNNDLYKLLPLLSEMFNQFYFQFISEPNQFLNKTNNRSNMMTFNWKGKSFRVYEGVTKLMCSAAYIFSYYTLINPKQLYDLKRPLDTNQSFKKKWYSMSVFKRRALKQISIEIGENNNINIPKYALTYFERLLEVSKLISPEEGSFLFNAFFSGHAVPLSHSPMNHFVSGWFVKYFPMVDDRGIKLTPVLRRFRVTGAMIAQIYHGTTRASLLLNNTPETVRKHYSDGNPYSNNLMLNDSLKVLENSVREKEGIKSAKAKACIQNGVEVLSHESYMNQLLSIEKNPNGTYCNSQSKSKTQSYTQRLINRNLINEDEKLNCSNLKACFDCKHQVFVDTVDDIWSLLSFKEHIEDSIFEHKDEAHFLENYGNTLAKIEIVLKRFKVKHFKLAKLKIDQVGRHPIWND